MNNKTALLTGVTGQDGSYLTKLLFIMFFLYGNLTTQTTNIKL